MVLDNFYKDKRILVTGGSGLLGTHLVRVLSESGAIVRSVFHERDPQERLDSVEYVQYDLRNYDDCRKATNGMDYVFHCAAKSLGAKVIKEDPKSLVTHNILINSNLLDASVDSGVKRFLFVSSNVVYPVLDHSVKEEDATGEFFEFYKGPAIMKYFTEKLCDFYSSRYLMKCIVVRPANYFGPYDKIGEGSHVIPALIERALSKEDPFVVWGTGENVKDLIYVEDVALGIKEAMKRDTTPVNIGSGKGYKVKEIVKIILELTSNQDRKIYFDSSKPDAIMYRVLDTRKSGFIPQTDLREAIKKTIEWHKSRKIHV